MRAAAAPRPHGTRAKYLHEGCRCFSCRVANANAETARAAARRTFLYSLLYIALLFVAMGIDTAL